MNPDISSIDEGTAQNSSSLVTARFLSQGTVLISGVLFFTILGWILLRYQWDLPLSTAFMSGIGLSLVVLTLPVLVSLRHVIREYGHPSITVPTWITLFRGSLVILFVGIFVGSASTLASGQWVVLSPDMQWMLVLLFTGAGVLDAVDGAVARRFNAVSSLGAELDAEIDALVMLFGSLAAVLLGGASTLFILVGFARYWFVGSLWLLERSGHDLRELPPSRIRTPLSIAALGAISLALIPTIPGILSWWISFFIAMPFLTNFVWDWLRCAGMTDSPR